MSLAAERVGLRLGGREVLRDISIAVTPGRVHALLGPNGAGKSSLLRILSGELRPAIGSVSLDAIALPRWKPAELARRRAVLPQAESLRFGFSAAEVVALGRLPCRPQPAAREARIVQDALAAADVALLAERRYTALSGGERQRVQLARVLAQVWEPPDGCAPYLLLDEPTARLDLAHQHACMSVARGFAARGAGVLAVLHDPNLALAYADEVSLLQAGERVATGAPATVLSPDNIARVFGVRVHAVECEGKFQLAVLGPAGAAAA